MYTFMTLRGEVEISQQLDENPIKQQGANEALLSLHWWTLVSHAERNNSISSYVTYVPHLLEGS